MRGTAHSGKIEFLLNGEPVCAEEYRAHTTLLDFVRDRGLTGAKEGCAEGECGACTVLLVKPDEYLAVNSCLMFLPMAAGQEIVTVEGLAQNGELAAAQQAMAAAGGSQCGYCTPGFVMSLHAGGDGSGNLCRCTGYRPIRDAVESVRQCPAARASGPAIAAFESESFHRPGTLPECFDVMARYPDATLVAGATDLALKSNLRGRRFDRLVSLEAVTELKRFHETDDEVEIGAGLTLTEIDGLWTSAPAVWKEWVPLFASPMIRNRATLGGNLATASPIGDAAPMLLAMDARLRIAGPAGERVLPLSEFFLAYRKTALARGELLASVLIGTRHLSGARFFKAAKRRTDDISTVAACFAIDVDGRGRIGRVRLAYGGVAATPIRAVEAEDAILGLRWNDSAVHRAQDVLARTLRPIGDHRGSAAYRLALAQNLLEKFWWEQQSEAAA